MYCPKRPTRSMLTSGRAQPRLAAPKQARVQAQAAATDSNFTMSTEELKAALLDSFWGTERGLSASAESRADINELISQLEAASPVENPAEAQEKLSGTWKLAYTSNSELMALLALSNLPLVTVHDIKQTINALTGTVVNSLDISVPGSRTALSTTAAITVQSPKRVNLKFEKSTISTPKLMTELDLPDETEVMGQRVDLRNLKSALQPLQEASKGLVSQIASFVDRQPDLSLPVPKKNADTWLLTTYLDDELRISRGDMGSIFVLTREVYQVDDADWEPPAGALPSPAMAQVTAPPGESISEKVESRVEEVGSAVKREVNAAERAAVNTAKQMEAEADDMAAKADAVADDVEKGVDALAEDVDKTADAVEKDVKKRSATKKGKKP